MNVDQLIFFGLNGYALAIVSVRERNNEILPQQAADRSARQAASNSAGGTHP